MKKSDLMILCGTQEAVGKLFAKVNKGIPLSRSAVCQWGERIPELREFQLRKLYPDIDKRIENAKVAERIAMHS